LPLFWAFQAVPPSLVAGVVPPAAPELYHLPGFHEPFSVVTHLLGAVVFLFLGFRLLRRGRGDRARMVFLGIYAASCVLLFSMSGVYHMMVRGGSAGQVMGRLDHGAIFVLIAGTFTPTHGILFRGWLRWGPLFFIWAAGITGITLKTVFFDDVAEWLGLSFYLTLGWLGIFSATLLARRYGVAFIRPLIWGAIAYTVGGIIDHLRWPTVIPRVVEAHEVFHVAVLVGAVFHWRFIWQFASGEVQRTRFPTIGLGPTEGPGHDHGTNDRSSHPGSHPLTQEEPQASEKDRRPSQPPPIRGQRLRPARPRRRAV
jgi:channel protein (hemolysin III family)